MFLDRDGVINEDLGYVSSDKEFVFKDGIIQFLKLAQESYNFKFIIITNQSGIGRGYFSEGDFRKLMSWVEKKLLIHNIQILDIFHCPYHPKKGIGSYKRDSYDRKPSPGMILKAVKKHKINLKNSVMIGDKQTDVDAALKANVEKIFLLSNNKKDKNHDKKSNYISINEFDEIFQYL